MTPEQILPILLRQRGWHLVQFVDEYNGAIIERGRQRERITLPDPWMARHNARRWAEKALDSLDYVEAEQAKREAIKPWSPYP